MKLSILEKIGWVEPVFRVFFEKYPTLKRIVKRKRVKYSQGLMQEQYKKVNINYWESYKKKIEKEINSDDIILIHSAMDGLDKIGISPTECLNFLKNLVKEKQCTIVMACFPITNLKPPNEKSRPYDPKKTLCWTGMLSNAFIADKDCIRTRFPYNSLAAIGPKAEDMMAYDLDAKLVYDKNSAWQYCYHHHAKIFFMGVKASGSNTMGIHMLPDFMGEEWPIDGWYKEKNYKVRIDNKIIEVPVISQRGFWYKYVMEEGTSGRLKKAGILEEQSIGGCNLGVVSDCHDMLDYLASEVKKGKLTYLIPRKYYKKR